MEEITPDLVARIASRLFNEGPHSNPATAAHTAMPDTPSMANPAHAPSLPVSPGMPPHAPSMPGSPASSSPSGYAQPSSFNQPSSFAAAPSTPFAQPGAQQAGSIFPQSASFPSQSTASSPSYGGSHAPSGHSLPNNPAEGGGYAYPNAAPIGHSTTGPESRQLPGHASSPTHHTSTSSAYPGLSNFVRNIRQSHVSGHDPGVQRPESSAGSPSSSSLQSSRGSAGYPHLAGGGARPLDVPSIREDFPILRQKVHGRPLAWFDNAATTQKPQCVIDAISKFYQEDNSNIHRAAHTLAARATDAYEGARQKVQSFIGASTVKEIVFVRGTTEGINLITQTYGRKFLQPGDEIVMSVLEHHANIVPWQMIAKEKGAVVRVIPVNDRGEIMLEEYQKLLGPRTKLVALTQASNSLGTILPVAEMTQMAKRYGARVLIDGAQSVAHIPVNMQELGADFFVFSGHKIFGPSGIGAVYIREELHDVLPPWQGGGNMIRNVTFEETSYSDAPAKFEAGTPNLADAVGLGAALDYVSRLGLRNIASYEHELLQYGTERLLQINGLRLIGQARDKVGVMSFVLPNKRTEDIGRLLDLEGIAVRAGHHCSQPSLRRFGVESTVRPSLSFYNTHGEIDRLVDAIKRIQRLP